MINQPRSILKGLHHLTGANRGNGGFQWSQFTFKRIPEFALSTGRVLRPALVECLWRLCMFQPDYRVIKKWRPELLNPKTSRPRRKKIIVAMARTFAVDWWRVRTGRCKAEHLGLKLQPALDAPKTKKGPATI